MKLLVLLHLSIVISIISAMADQTLAKGPKQIRRFERQFSFADGLTSGSILRNLWKRNGQFDSQQRRSRRQFTSFADGSASGTVLSNLWKREAVLSAAGSDLLGGGRTKRYLSAAADGFTSGSILSNLWKRGTVADNAPKTAWNGRLRTKRSDGAASFTSGTILGNLWKRQAFFDAEIPTFTK